MSDISPRKKCEKLLPECECSEIYSKSAVLYCRNVSDFEAFNDILSNGFVFDEGTTFYITLSGNTVLPKGFLSGLFVSELIVDDLGIQKMEEGAFDGVLDLGSISVKMSSIKFVVSFSPETKGVFHLRLKDPVSVVERGRNIISVPDRRQPQNLTEVRRISFVNNYIAHVADDVFQTLQVLETPEELRLSYNQLLHVDQLFVGTKPKVLYLNNNNLSSFRGVLLDSLNGMTTLKLSYNPIEWTPQFTLDGIAEYIHFLYLDHCLIRKIEPQIRNKMLNLREFDLSFNMIENLPNRSIGKK
ncbi:uncharacterized protein CEXT_435201 [Caerostris extrusa]|uniref:Uncharacterized protein n=1 Tax=Caerostris extrusa TaxID=172846 RepID=A0AAV4SLH8_CAEEX|nr:uncharacterized protein CEXT_435201 [Caerostris extrusa]